MVHTRVGLMNSKPGQPAGLAVQLQHLASGESENETISRPHGVMHWFESTWMIMPSLRRSGCGNMVYGTLVVGL